MDVNEAASGRTPLGDALEAGVRSISYDQVVTFRRYIRQVLPADGFVFWVKADLINPGALLNIPVSLLGGRFGRGRRKFDAQGSLHYTTQSYQLEDENFALNQVVFTALEEIDDLNEVGPHVMYIGEFDGLRFAFSARASFYEQASLWHYRGDAIYPAMATQIIDEPGQLNLVDTVVSNSMPLWLTLNKIAPVYPAMLIPDNLPPPYIAISIDPNRTEALQASAYIDPTGSHWQLVSDTVRVTMYGLRNNGAQDWVDYVNDRSLNWDIFGLMNMPVARDERRGQNELNILAQKKALEYKISYYQSRVRALSLQFITHCIPTYVVQDVPTFVPQAQP